ncbi:hypothetical protein BDZ45DRAFT_744062 [Acephala macrosclerotiorum]|nr:hypothetical protein BDZ45DRAFT_744062 [Acephala macrosclerotiorum]
MPSTEPEYVEKDRIGSELHGRGPRGECWAMIEVVIVTHGRLLGGLLGGNDKATKRECVRKMVKTIGDPRCPNEELTEWKVDATEEIIHLKEQRQRAKARLATIEQDQTSTRDLDRSFGLGEEYAAKEVKEYHAEEAIRIFHDLRSDDTVEGIAWATVARVSERLFYKEGTFHAYAKINHKDANRTSHGGDTCKREAKYLRTMLK